MEVLGRTLVKVAAIQTFLKGKAVDKEENPSN